MCKKKYTIKTFASKQPAKALNFARQKHAPKINPYIYNPEDRKERNL